MIRVDKSNAFWLDNQKYYQGFTCEAEDGEEIEMTFLSSSLDGIVRWFMIFDDHASISEPAVIIEKARSLLSTILKKLKISFSC